MAGGWTRIAMATLVLAVLVPLLALWSTLLPRGIGPEARDPGNDSLVIRAFARSLSEDVLRQAVLCVGNAATKLAEAEAEAQAGGVEVTNPLAEPLRECARERFGLTAIFVLAASKPVALPSSTAKGIAGEERFGDASHELLTAIGTAVSTSRVSYAPLPDASGGRSNGLDQVVPLFIKPATVLVLRHRLSHLPRDLLDRLGPNPQPALIVGADAKGRGTLLPRSGGLRLVADGNTWRPEWSRSSQGHIWLLTGLTVALLGAGLLAMKIVDQTERFRTDIERSVPVGLLTMDRHGRILWANPAFLALSGWPAEQVVGRLPPYVYWDDATRAERQDQLESLMNGRLPSDTYTANFMRPDGSTWPASVTAQKMQSGKGWMLACEDISDETAAAQRTARLLQALQHLQLKAELFRQLEIRLHGHASTVAACALRLESTVASIAAGDMSLASEKAKAVLETALKAKSQAVELLQASKPEEPQLVPLWDAVEDGISAAQLLMPNSNTLFINSVDKDLPRVRLPRGILLFIVSNLVHNGVRAMASERLAQRRLTVFSDEVEAAGQVHLLVEDHGCGMSEAQRASAFELGVSGYAEGNGFGLCNSRELARAWGGDLVILQTATAGALRGTTMQLTLPLADTNEENPDG